MRVLQERKQRAETQLNSNAFKGSYDKLESDEKVLIVEIENSRSMLEHRGQG
jgi:hypothetical protein